MVAGAPLFFTSMFKLLHDGRENHTRYIPPEIADFVIDLLSNDQQSLISCSAVSRTWLPDSRHYLVQKIHIHGANVTQLINLLDSPYCALSKKNPYLKDLVVSLSTEAEWSGQETDLESCSSLCESKFPKTLTKTWRTLRLPLQRSTIVSIHSRADLSKGFQALLLCSGTDGMA